MWSATKTTSTSWISTNARVRWVNTEGIIATAAGGGEPRAGGGDGGPAAGAVLVDPDGLALGPDSSLYVADKGHGLIRRVQSFRPLKHDGQYIVPSRDGSEAYVFSLEGRHLKTRDGLTGANVYSFGYDSAGRLASITDRAGLVTTVERSGDGAPLAMVAPAGQRTSFTLDGAGYLAGITCPLAKTSSYSYTTSGLMTSYTDRKGGVHSFTYDELGRLTKDQNPAGGSLTLAQGEAERGYSVTATTAEGRTSTYTSEVLADGSARSTVTTPAGARNTSTVKPNGDETLAYADGTVVTSRWTSDPRWGLTAPILAERTVRTPGGVTSTVENSALALLTAADDPLSLSYLELRTTRDGATTTTSYDGAERTVTEMSATGRSRVWQLDALGREVGYRAGTLNPWTTAYDTRGRVSTTQQGESVWRFGYDALDQLSQKQYPDGSTASYEKNAAGLITGMTDGEGDRYEFGYDNNGQPTTVKMPSASTHQLDHTPIGLSASYTPPENGSYARTYDRDGHVTAFTLPSGRSVNYSSDVAGRRRGLTYGGTTVAIAYSDATTRPASVTRTEDRWRGEDRLQLRRLSARRSDYVRDARRQLPLPLRSREPSSQA